MKECISLNDFLKVQMIMYYLHDINIEQHEALINFLDTKAFLQYLIDTDNIDNAFCVSIDEIESCRNLLF